MMYTIQKQSFPIASGIQNNGGITKKLFNAPYPFTPYQQLCCVFTTDNTTKKKVSIQLHTAFFDLYTTHKPKFSYRTLYTVNFGFEFFQWLLYTSEILIRIYTIICCNNFFCSRIPSTYRLIWCILTSYCSLKIFNVFLVMWIVNLIKTYKYY